MEAEKIKLLADLRVGVPSLQRCFHGFRFGRGGVFTKAMSGHDNAM
jgi:hypothetical protein